MGVREIGRFLEQWQMEVKDLRRRMILAPTPWERERWYAISLLAQGWTSSATAEALERDPHTIGRWAARNWTTCRGISRPSGVPPEGMKDCPIKYDYQQLDRRVFAKDAAPTLVSAAEGELAPNPWAPLLNFGQRSWPPARCRRHAAVVDAAHGHCRKHATCCGASATKSGEVF